MSHNHHHEHEHNCSCHHHEQSCGCGHNHSHGNRKTMYLRLTLGAIFTVLHFFLPIPGYLLLIPYFILGYDVFLASVKNILKLKFFDEQFLMTIATIGAIALGEFTEACAVMFFYQAGELLGDITADKCRNSIKNMFDFAPDFARKITETGYETVSPQELKIGDNIAVFAGEKIPCDGNVYSGSSYTDTSSLTGESMPVYISEGSKVLGGVINLDSPVNIEITKEYKDSSVAKVVRLLEDAAHNKSKSEKFITAFAKKYTPAVVIIALISAILLPLLPGFTIESGIYTALMFLVVSCPCSLVISIPLTLFAGIGNASKNKILFKGNNSLESLYKIRNFAFDKTGTLTNGKFTIAESTLSAEDLQILSNTERHSNHPLAGIVAKEATKPYMDIAGITELKGMGITANYNNMKIIAGNEKLLKHYKIENISKAYGTAIHLAIDGEYRGYVKLADELKDDTKDTISYLKEKGAKITLLSGDAKEAVAATSKEAGIDEYFAALLPQHKVEKASELKKHGKLAYIGDGINDAPVLALSDIGISMGGAASDIAIANSDIILLDDNLKSLTKAINISRKTMKIVYQNIILSLSIKLIVMLLGFLKLSSMPLAIFADVGVMIITVLNSIRAMR